MSANTPPSRKDPHAANSADETPAAVCILVFNANDPCGAGGLTADICAIASVGGHPMPVATGCYVRDSAEVFDHFPLDDELVADQARAVLEDIPVRAIKVGFAGSPEVVSAIAQITADYPELPVIAYMPDLSWWRDDLIDQYLDAFNELLLPQVSVLVGNHNVLWRWLLPDWQGDRPPSARDLAQAAAQSDVPYVLVTGMPTHDQYLDNTLASPEAILGNARFERFEGSFVGAGDTLSATLAALIASGCDLGESTSEALAYLDGCLANGFRPGMGQVLPDRMFWAQPDDDEPEEEPEPDPSDTSGFEIPPHDTKH